MGEMHVSESLKWDREGQWQRHQDFVRPLRPKRMSMDDFVGER